MYKHFLNVKAEEYNIPVIHNVILALASYKSPFLCGNHIAAALVYKLVKAYYLGADKAAFKIGMDFARRLRSLCALLNSPGAHLGLARGKVRNKP